MVLSHGPVGASFDNGSLRGGGGSLCAKWGMGGGACRLELTGLTVQRKGILKLVQSCHQDITRGIFKGSSKVLAQPSVNFPDFHTPMPHPLHKGGCPIKVEEIGSSVVPFVWVYRRLDDVPLYLVTSTTWFTVTLTQLG